MTSDDSIRVAVVEDLLDERQRLVALLDGSAGLTCVAACATAEEALKVIPPAVPHVILMDIQLPCLSGIDCVRRIKNLLPDTQVMMLTVVQDDELVFESLVAGANSYLLKKEPPDQLRSAIYELHNSGAPMTGQIARLLLSTLRKPSEAAAELAKLTPTEEKILRLIARGLLYKEIAEQLGISVSTVRTHIWHIYKKLHVNNRTEAVNKVFGRILR